MDWIDSLAVSLEAFIPLLATLAVMSGVLAVGHRLLIARHREPHGEKRFAGQIAMLVLTGIGVVFVILALPIETATRGQLLSLFGLILTAVIGLSSTTFVSNAMAGLMLRALNNFRPGDFVRIGEQFGRVTERGLFHTEVQTEDRDLTTLPNLLIVTQPVTVLRASGTIASATVSLGYDVPHSRVVPLLEQAATDAGLRDPFVQIVDLGDFSVSYRIAGFLSEIKQILSARSRLRACVLDTLHGNGIEIVSPTFMNQRLSEEPVVPSRHTARSTPPRGTPRDKASPEDMVFDKAERVEELERLRARVNELTEELQEIEQASAGLADDDAEKSRLAQRRRRVELEAEQAQTRVDFLAGIEDD
ncbi:MAG: mechanosensitive ion channel [bacterium]|nr:mechanosensitive ion channel [bacterium]MCP5067720.1 mechanosensitive ion channel [bacterium]